MGNSLAVRLPRRVVEILDLREGDAIEVHVVGPPAIYWIMKEVK